MVGNTYPGLWQRFRFLNKAQILKCWAGIELRVIFTKIRSFLVFRTCIYQERVLAISTIFLVMPTNSRFSKRIKANNFKPFFLVFPTKRETASPGYYSVDFDFMGFELNSPQPKERGFTGIFPEDDTTQIHIDLEFMP